MEKITEYFPELTSAQREQMGLLDALYRDLNSKVNVISRRDIDALYLHHVLHSLAIAKIIGFAKGTRIVDVGTGGGFPGIPLAILFPNAQFTLVDSVAKKVSVVHSVVESLELKNVLPIRARVEDLTEVFDFAVVRAVAPLADIHKWVRNRIHPGGINNLPNGIIALKGGDLKDELAPYRKHCKAWKVNSFFEEDYFEGKMVIHIPVYR